MGLVSGDAVELDQGQLDFGMPGDNRFFGLWAVVGDQELVYETNSRFEHLAVASGAVVCDRALQHMPHVVEFVAGRLRLGKHALRRVVIDVVGVQITAGLLRGHDVINEFLNGRAKLRTTGRLQREPRCFDPFVNVGVGIDRPTLNTLTLADQAAEIHHAPVGLQQIVHGGNAFRNVGLAAAPPEPGLDGHRAHGDIPQLRVARFGEVLDALLFPARAIDQRRYLSLRGLLHTWSRSPAVCKQFSPG